MLIYRVLTALVLIPLVVYGIFFTSSQAFALILAAIMLVAALEWTHIANINSIYSYLFVGTNIFLMWLLWHLQGNYGEWTQSLVWLSVVFWIFATVLVKNYPHSQFWLKKLYQRFVLGLLVLIPAWYSLLLLKQTRPIEILGYEISGATLILFLMLNLWLADSGAYFAGKKWGRTKLIPRVSPGKTVQGVWGALISCSIFVLLLHAYLQADVLMLVLLLLSSWTLVFFSIVGDLFESMIKRQSGVKDSGNILPGHGGVLDRIDSLTAGAPVFLLLLSLFQAVL